MPGLRTSPISYYGRRWPNLAPCLVAAGRFLESWGPRDDFERRALRRLRQSQGRETAHEFTAIGGQRVVRYAQARVMKRTCVECHNSHPQSPRTDWQEGVVRGVLVIIRPLDKDEARVSEALHLALLLCAVGSGVLVGGACS